MNRKTFLRMATTGAAGICATPLLLAHPTPTAVSDPIPYEVVKEFVLKAHSDFGRVQELMEEYPKLLNATIDWGDGDFESAIGAMGHMGHREEALWMIDKGARFDIFVLTMLGRTTEVVYLLDAMPSLLHSIGPHGFTLLHHAKVGGEEAADLYGYLQGKGMKEERVKYFNRPDSISK